MLPVEKQYNPFIRRKDSTRRVMSDVIIALLPCIVITWFAYGFIPVMVVLVAIGSALLGEFLFNSIFTREKRSLDDGSAIVTGILLAFTIGPFTPLPIVAVGGFFAVIFGKLLWGGLGKNRFNPALVGREAMVVFFPAVMNSQEIWRDKDVLKQQDFELFGNDLLDRIFYYPDTALGEYSPFFLIVGGLFLLWRRRISWHIPLAMFAGFTAGLLIFRNVGIAFSLGGILLGTIYMATDMPTSSSTNMGKIYFGAMAGILALVCILFGAARGYLSYSLLIMNAFVIPINWIFRPRTWGKKTDRAKRIGEATLLTLAIGATTALVLWFHYMEFMIYLVLAYMLYSVIRFARKLS